MPSGVKGEMDPQILLESAQSGIGLTPHELVRLVSAGAKAARVRVPCDRQLRNIIASAELKFRDACEAAGLDVELMQSSAVRVGIRTMSKVDVDDLLNSMNC